MNRRTFIQLSLATGANLLLPRIPLCAPANVINSVTFNPAIYTANKPQVIMVFLYGGASELAGNFTNFAEFKNLSQSSYEQYFGTSNLTATPNGFWSAAGGQIIEDLMARGDMSVLRTCFSKVRYDNNNRSHGSCVMQNQRGSFDIDNAGIFANLAEILRRNNIVDSNSVMPFLSMEGDSGFFSSGDINLASYLKPLNINENLQNPYERSIHFPDASPTTNDEMSVQMDVMARAMNPEGKIKEALANRAELDQFIKSIPTDPPAGVVYPNNSFANKLKTAINIMVQNRETLILSTGSGGLGGWDDHSNANDYPTRMTQLLEALRSASDHLSVSDPGGNISIMVMGEFGRGVNLNGAKGWDHGNLQSMFVVRGNSYFRNLGAYGTTTVDNQGQVNRLYLKPANGSYWFEPLGVASTIYSIFGITNPDVLTGGIGEIAPLIA